MELTIGELIDRLITSSQKCWYAQDKIMDPSLSDEEIVKYAKLAQMTNIDRSKLVKEIDTFFGQARQIDSIKSYDKESK